MARRNDPFGFDKAINWGVVNALNKKQLDALNDMFSKKQSPLPQIKQEVDKDRKGEGTR